MACISQIERPVPGESLAVASRTRGQNTVEHIDTTQCGADDVVGFAYTHQVAGAILRKMRHRRLEDVEHCSLPFANCKSADRITVKPDST